MDRASGSGVFARDPDAQLDMIELELSEDVKNWEAKRGATAWRLESSLREFENIVPVNFWFEYPIHRVDDGKSLTAMPTQGSMEAGRIRNKFSKTADTAEDEFRTAFLAVNFDGTGALVSDIAAYMGLAERTVRDRIKKMGGEFTLDKGKGIVRCETEQADLEPDI